MADLPALTPQDYDPWRLATPLQLLTLLERLGVSMSEVARWLHVPRSSVSMWRHETRTIPPKHIAALHEHTRRAFEAAADLTTKAVSLAPTAAVGEAIRAEFGALYGRWKTEVLHEAGTMRRGLQANVQTFDQDVAQQPFRADALARLDRVYGTIRQQVEILMELEGVAPDPEQELIARLTAAHEAAHPTPHAE
jgi:predicted transcriptional regulator